MLQNKVIFSAWKGKSFFTKSCLLSNNHFQEKPPWLKKLKMKQALFQKEDGLPIFLKMGFRDKLLFNITWVGLIGGMCYGFYSLYKCDLENNN